MKKTIPYFIGVIILVIVLITINPHFFQIFFSSIFSTKTTEAPVGVGSLQSTTTPVITLKTVTDKDPNGKWIFSATYPVFDKTLGLKFEAINSQIEAEIQVIKLQTTGDVSSNISPENAPSNLTPFGITITSDATTSAKFGTVSVLFSTFVDGGLLAHPYTNFESHTFNLSDGTEKTLEQFFVQRDFLVGISRAATAKLKEYYSGMDNKSTNFLDNNEGLTASSTNFDVFMFSNDNLILQFAEYQIGSRPYGAPRIEIPFTDLPDSVTSS